MIVTICPFQRRDRDGQEEGHRQAESTRSRTWARWMSCVRTRPGTLTRDEIILEKHCDVALREDDAVSCPRLYHQPLPDRPQEAFDRAVLAHEGEPRACAHPELVKVDEIPFDFERRIMWVVGPHARGQRTASSPKGAPEAILPASASASGWTQSVADGSPAHRALKKEYELLSADGFACSQSRPRTQRRARALRRTPPRTARPNDTTWILEGYVAFLDPPKESALAAIRRSAPRRDGQGHHGWTTTRGAQGL